MIFASNGADFARTTLETTLEILIKVIFIGSGVLMLIFGVFELVVTLMGQNPDAKNKSIMGFGTGIVLIVLGIAFSAQISSLVGFFIS